MKYRFITALLICLPVLTIHGQDRLLHIDSIMSNPGLFVRPLTNLQWRGNTDFVTWQSGNYFIQRNILSGKTDTLLTLDSFNRFAPQKAERMPFLRWQDGLIAFQQDSMLYTYSLDKSELKDAGVARKTGANRDEAPLTGHVAYTVENNLYVLANGNRMAVTSDPDTGFVSGQSVHRNEFGINKGTFWSPKGHFLAFYRMNQSMVTNYPLVNVNTRIASVVDDRYPMAGMKSHEVKLGVFDPVTRKSVYMQTGEPNEQYLTNIAWSPDEATVYIAVLNHGQNHLKLNAYEAATGKFIKTLFEEKNDRYVEAQEPMLFLPSNNRQFIWQSQRDGYNHLYLYDTDGRLLKQLTSGNWVVKGIQGFSHDGKKLFISTNEPSPIETHTYALDLKTGKRTRITQAPGTHRVNYRPDGKYFIDTYSNLDTPLRTVVLDAKGKTVAEVHTASDPLQDYKKVDISVFPIRNSSGQDLYSRIMKPADMQAGKKYPVLVYVYGGPHSQMVTNSWMGGGNLFFYLLAQQGYIVFSLDNRGTANRGFEFESIIHRNLGTVEVEDQMAGVNWLKAQPYVDPDRIGVDGWSYGGFMSLSMMLKQPGVFKVATAGGPVVDWDMYEVMYGERYMDTPQENPDGYRNASLLNYTDNLQGKLLVIHGAQDNTVVWQHSLKLLDAFIKSKKQIDYFIFPNHEHNVRGQDRTYLYRKLFDYYEENLKP